MFLKLKKLGLLAVAMLFAFVVVGCGKADAKILAQAKENILLSSDIQNLTGDLDLPTYVKVGEETILITWVASTSEYLTIGEIDADNKLKALVTRPAADVAQPEITLTATLTYNKNTTTREWTVYVKPMPSANIVTCAGAKASPVNENISIIATVSYVMTSGIMIHDATGGFYVYTGSAPAANVLPGAEVKVTGTRALYYAMPQVASPTVEVLTPAPASGYDYSSAPEVTSTALSAYSENNVANYAKMVKVSGLVVKVPNYGAYPEYELKDVINDKVVYIYNSSTAAVKAELNDKVGQYVSMVVITYDFHSTQKIWRNLGVEGTVVEIDAPSISDEAKMNSSKTELQNKYNNKSFAFDLDLITTTVAGATITWASDTTAVIANDGTFVMPAVDTTVILTASIVAGELNEDYTVTVTAKAIELSTVKEAIDAIDAADVDFLLIEGIIIGLDSDGYYYVADETGVLYVRHKVTADNLTIGDRVQIIGKGTIFNKTSSYARQISGNYKVLKLDELTHPSPLEAVDVELSDFDFTITGTNLLTAVPTELLYGQIITFDLFVTIQGTHNNVYLAVSNETGADKILVYYKSVDVDSLKDLVGTKVKVTAVVYDYSVNDGWRLGFLGREGDIQTDALTEAEKLVIAQDEIEAIVKEGDEVTGNLGFITNTARTVTIGGTKYVWTTNDLTTIDAEGAFTAPDVDKTVVITVNCFLDGDIEGTPDATWNINVTAKAAPTAQGQMTHNINFGTAGITGYNDGEDRERTFKNLVNNQDYTITLNTAQISSSTNAPHQAGNIFAVMGVGIVRSGVGIYQPSYIMFEASNQIVSKVAFDLTWWSGADSNNLGSLGTLELQVWNEVTSTWDSVQNLKPLLDATKYTTVEVNITNGTKFRIYGAPVADLTGTFAMRIIIDNLKMYN